MRRTRRQRLLTSLVVAFAVLVLLGGVAYKGHGSRRYQVAGEIVPRVDTSEKVVALTFDDGPTAEDADAVLDVLAAEDVRATFYLNGAPASEHPEVVRRMLADGHELGNHTWSHRRMVLVSPGTVASEVERTDAVLRDAGAAGELTFRPPYGKKLVALPVYLARHDRTTVMWDVTAETFTDTPQTTGQIVDGTVSQTRPGSIILLHPWNGRTHTQEAIGPIVRQLRADGYTFVSVSELLAMRTSADAGRRPAHWLSMLQCHGSGG